jgi:hypothetical protein
LCTTVSHSMMTNSTASQTRSTPLLLAGYGGLIFIATFITLSFFAHPYRPLRDSISALELTQVGVLQQANFILFGILLCLFAWGLRRELQRGWGVFAIPFFRAWRVLQLWGMGCSSALYLT